MLFCTDTENIPDNYGGRGGRRGQGRGRGFSRGRGRARGSRCVGGQFRDAAAATGSNNADAQWTDVDAAPQQCDFTGAPGVKVNIIDWTYVCAVFQIFFTHSLYSLWLTKPIVMPLKWQIKQKLCGGL